MQLARNEGNRTVQTSTSSLSSASRLMALLALPATLLGCSNVTTPPTPPGGGQQLVLSYDQFGNEVAPILTRQGCDATGDCHGGGIRGTLELSPPGAKDLQFDYDQVVLQVSSAHREQSPILTEPLAVAAGGTPHGFKPFASVTDSDYVAIRSWILAGELR